MNSPHYNSLQNLYRSDPNAEVSLKWQVYILKGAKTYGLILYNSEIVGYNGVDTNPASFPKECNLVTPVAKPAAPSEVLCALEALWASLPNTSTKLPLMAAFVLGQSTDYSEWNVDVNANVLNAYRELADKINGCIKVPIRLFRIHCSKETVDDVSMIRLHHPAPVGITWASNHSLLFDGGEHVEVWAHTPRPTMVERALYKQLLGKEEFKGKRLPRNLTKFEKQSPGSRNELEEKMSEELKKLIESTTSTSCSTMGVLFRNASGEPSESSEYANVLYKQFSSTGDFKLAQNKDEWGSVRVQNVVHIGCEPYEESDTE